MNMIGVIFSNIYDSAMGELTKNRTLASLPYGGRYRMIDFVLSNMANSGLETIGVITKYNYQSLMDHLGSCEEWDLNRKNGHVFILPPFGTGQTSVYQGKLEALQGALTYLNRGKGDYVLLSDSNIICNIDYDSILDAHIKSGATITAVVNHKQVADQDDTTGLVIKADDDNNVTDILIDYTYTKEDYVGLGMFIIEKQLLISAIKEAVSHGFFHLERDFIQRGFQDGRVSVNLHEFKGAVLRNRDTETYFNSQMKLLDESIRQDIFNPRTPIYTKVRDEVPSYYHEDSVVNNALIADGCRLVGTVENCIISRDVQVEEGAVVKNSIIMQGTTIQKGCQIEYAIIDKDVLITENRTLVGAPTAPLIISKGQKI